MSAARAILQDSLHRPKRDFYRDDKTIVLDHAVRRMAGFHRREKQNAKQLPLIVQDCFNASTALAVWTAARANSSIAVVISAMFFGVFFDFAYSIRAVCAFFAET